MTTERHNVACHLIMKALNKASLGTLVSMDIGNKDRLAQQNLHTPQNTTNRMIPKLLLPPNLSDRNRLTCSHPDAIIVIAKPLNTSSASQRRVRTWYTKRPEKNIWNGGDHTSCHLPQPLRPDEIPKKRRHVHLLDVKYCEIL